MSADTSQDALHAEVTARLAAGAELFPGAARERITQTAREEAALAARRDPLPGPLADAFGVPAREIAGLRVRPLVHYDFVAFRRLDSPLLRAGEQTVAYTDEEAYEMVWQLTRPAREVASVLGRGREAVREAAMELGFSVGPMEMADLMAEVRRVFEAAFSTALHYQARDASAGAGTVFTPPPAEQRTVSAGGSSISRG